MGFISKQKGVKLLPYRFPNRLCHIVFWDDNLPFTFSNNTRCAVRYIRSKSYALLFG